MINERRKAVLNLVKPILIHNKPTVTVSNDVLQHVKVPSSNAISQPTRRFKDVQLTNSQKELLREALTTLTDLRKFAIHYLEHTYGVKHLKANFVNSQMDKAQLATNIANYWFNETFYGNEYAGHRWNKKLTKVHSISAQRNLIELITNFDLYRQELKKVVFSSSLLDRKRYLYNQKGTNPNHHKAIHASSLSFNKVTRCLRFTTSSTMKPYVYIISNHYIYLPDYGKIFVKENLKSIRNKDLKVFALVRQSNGRIDLHITYKRTVTRKSHDLLTTGVDWNLTNHQPYTDIDNHGTPLETGLLKKVQQLDKLVNKKRSRFSYGKHHLRKGTNQYEKLQHQLNKATHKLSYVLDNRYIALSNDLTQQWDYLAMESLNYNQMIQERAKRNENKANHRSMIIKPARLHELVWEAFQRTGHTVCDIDCYKTSQMIYGSDYIYEKHSTADRYWYSEAEHRHVFRDQNAACNILYWSIFPNQHAKIHDRELQNQQRLQTGKDPLPEIKVSYIRQFN